MNFEFLKLGDAIHIENQQPPLTEAEQTAFALAASMISSLREFRNLRESVAMKIADTLDSLKEATDELNASEEDLEKRNIEVANLKKKIETATLEKNRIQNELEGLEQQKANYKDRIKKSESKTNALNQIISQLKQDEASLQSNIQKVEELISQQKNIFATLENTIENVKRKISQQKGVLTSLEEKPPRFILQRWLWMLFFGLSWKKELKSAEAQIVSHQEKLAENEEYLNSTNDYIKRLNYEKGLRDNISKLNTMISRHKGQVASLKKDSARTEKTFSLLSKNIEKLELKPPVFFLKRWLWMLFFGIQWKKELRNELALAESNRDKFATLQDETTSITEEINKYEYEHTLLTNIEHYRGKVNSIDEPATLKAIEEEIRIRKQLSGEIAALPIEKTEERLSTKIQDIDGLKNEIIRQDVPSATAVVANCKDGIEEINKQLDDLNQERESLQLIKRAVSGFATVGYPILPMVVRQPNPENNQRGLSFFLNPLQTNTRNVHIPDLNIDRNRVTEALDVINSFDEDTVFIKSDSDEKKSFAKIDSVFGFEKQIKSTIQTLNDLSKRSIPKEFRLPLIDADDAFGQYLTDLLDKNAVGPSSSFPMPPETAERIAELTKARKLVTALLKKAAEYDKIDRLLKGAERDLKELHNESTSIRKKAGEIGTAMLKKAHENSVLVRYHFYCPKCNVHPDFIQEFFDVRLEDIGNFKKMSNNRLKEMLRDFLEDVTNDTTGKKMAPNTKRAIADSWSVAFSMLDKIYEDMDREERYYSAKPHSDPLIKNLLYRNRKFNLKIYREIVFDLLLNPRVEFKKKLETYYQGNRNQFGTVSRQPGAIFNESTRMQYFVDKEEWRCPNCENKFDKDTALLGAVDKIKKDIEIPALSTLWNDDEIWKKTVGLIENVSREIRDRWQQETDTLLTPIGEYKADIRDLRNRIEEFLTRGKAAQKRLLTMVDDYTAHGIIAEKDAIKAREIADRNKNLSKSVDALLLDMNAREDSMQELPGKIGKMRETPSSPQTLISSRDAAVSLFVNSTSSRLLDLESKSEGSHVE